MSEPRSCSNQPQTAFGEIHEVQGFNFAQINDDPKLQSTVSNKKLASYLPQTTDQKRSHCKVKPNSIALQQSLNPILTKPREVQVSEVDGFDYTDMSQSKLSVNRLDQYEQIIQKLESDVRQHIRLEQQLKLHIESI